MAPETNGSVSQSMAIPKMPKDVTIRNTSAKAKRKSCIVKLSKEAARKIRLNKENAMKEQGNPSFHGDMHKSGMERGAFLNVRGS